MPDEATPTVPSFNPGVGECVPAPSPRQRKRPRPIFHSAALGAVPQIGRAHVLEDFAGLVVIDPPIRRGNGRHPSALGVTRRPGAGRQLSPQDSAAPASSSYG